MTVKVITDNPHIYEAAIFGASSGTETIDVSTLDDAVAINGTHQQRMNLLISYSSQTALNSYVKVEFASNSSGSTFQEYWRGYGTGEVFLKNVEANGNGDFRISFIGGGGSCYVFAKKTEGFRLASPYYRKVSGRRA